MKYTNLRQSVLHVAMGVHCNLFINKRGSNEMSLRIIQRLIKCGFNLDVTDSMHLTPIDYLFDRKSNEEAFCQVMEILILNDSPLYQHRHEVAYATAERQKAHFNKSNIMRLFRSEKLNTNVIKKIIPALKNWLHDAESAQ